MTQPNREPIHRSLWRLLTGFDPQPIAPPHLDPNLLTEPSITRAAGILHHQLHRIEYGLSPGGALRAWIKLCLRIAVVIGVPALILLPILSILFYLAGWGTGLMLYRNPDRRAMAFILWTSGLVSSLLFLLAVLFIVITPG